MTMQATVTTDLSASQTHIAAHGDVLVALQQLAKGHALIVKGSDLHYFPAFEVTVTQQSAWTFRIVRAR